MIGLVIGIAYGLAALVAARSIAGAIAWSWTPNSLRRDGTPDFGQWLGAAALGVMVGLVWPLALVVWKLPAPVIGAERSQRLRERNERIKELERELEDR